MAINLDLNLLSLIVFYAVLFILIYIKRKNIVVQNKILFLYKTQRFNRLMKRISDISPRFWRGFGYASIPVGFIAMAFVFAFLTYKLLTISAVPQLQLILPAPFTLATGPILFVSFWYFIISIFVVVLVHEGAHGVVAEAFRQKVKAAGAGLLAIIPLAFVEPDEKKLQKAPTKVQLSIFAAGAMANFVTAAIILLLSLFIFSPVVSSTVESNNVEIYALTKDFPAEQAGLQLEDRVLSINGIDTRSPADFSSVMQTVSPGDTVSIETERGTFNVVTTNNPRNESQAYIGVSIRAIDLQVKPELKEIYGNFPLGLLYLYNPIANTLPEYGLLQWIFALNLGIGIINMLPLGAIDGGRMASLVLQRGLKNPNRAKRVFSILTMASILLIVFNLIGPYIIRSFA
ncbi:MAG TPA: site-2 protease family protein [Candidatus Nanoarchaeia archaeon]|nr:site-2 protease family protein [Candidatus Nanoarchaeia archaeon]